ncbi:MAG TPA: hypothetical protein VMJ75_25565 [Candidatus Acidoferrales bacterium]|nr:hypothetical protein [Candidatus Acidoferrales bacterium]HXK07097.1 hypothetical protein [Verrucomicrobiae bacterium]
MRRLSIERCLILVFAFALLLSGYGWWQGSRELKATTTANNHLRQALGDLVVNIAAKDREIDRLQQALCQASEQLPLPHESDSSDSAER